MYKYVYNMCASVSIKNPGFCGLTFQQLGGHSLDLRSLTGTLC